MDRNERTRRQKQRAAAVRQRQNAAYAPGRRQEPRPGGPPAGSRSKSYDRTPGMPQRDDHAPLYDQDQGRQAAPQQARRRGKKRHLYLTKKELRRRARRRRLLALLCIAAVITAGILLSVTLLFKITRITVQTPEGVVLSAGSAASTPEPGSAPESGGDPGEAGSAAEPAGVPADPGAADSAAAPEALPEDAPSAEPPGDEPSPAPAEPAETQQSGTQPGSAAVAGPYTEQEILAALGVQTGENMFSFRVRDAEDRMALALPLLEKIEVRRRYPGTVIVEVTPAAATYCTQTAEGWLVLSASLKVMEITAEQPQGLTLLLCDAKATQPGTALQTLALDRLEQERAEAIALAQAAASASQPSSEPAPTMPPDEPLTDANRLAVDELMAALDAQGLLADVTAIDTANPEEIAFLYQGRISVLLGTANELAYKMQFTAYILLNEDGKGCSETDTGVLDASHILADGKIRPVFRQGTPELPSQRAAAQAAPEPDPAADPAAADLPADDAAADPNAQPAGAE